MSLADGENEEGTGYGRDGNLNHLVFVDYRGDDLDDVHPTHLS
jgi:hypothetical protein